MGMKILRTTVFAGWMIAMAALLTVGCIETAALGQPSTLTAFYRHPHEIKGAIRFFPDLQEYVYSIARPTMFASFPVFFLLAILHNWLGNRQEERTKRRLLKRFFSGDTGR
jgi:hypothetical protein